SPAMPHLALLSGQTRRLLITLSALLMLAACAGTDEHRPGSPDVPAPTIALDPAQRGNVVLTAVGLMETRYRYGGQGPATGFDCSGLVAYVFRHAASQSLPHNTAAIARLSRPIRKSQLKAGDFVFFNTLNRPFS